MIISFDTGDEVFHNILLPDSLCDSSIYEPSMYRFDLQVTLWNEFVALFGLDGVCSSFESYGVWVLDDFDVAKGSWTKRLTVVSSVGITKVLEFWKSDQILMIATKGDIVSYSLVPISSKIFS